MCICRWQNSYLGIFEYSISGVFLVNLLHCSDLPDVGTQWATAGNSASKAYNMQFINMYGDNLYTMGLINRWEIAIIIIITWHKLIHMPTHIQSTYSCWLEGQAYVTERGPYAPSHVSSSSSSTDSPGTLAVSVLYECKSSLTDMQKSWESLRVIMATLADICSDVELFRFSSFTIHSFTPLWHTQEIIKVFKYNQTIL